ncbi:PH domain-containing protein [Microbacterium keratanolyticum]
MSELSRPEGERTFRSPSGVVMMIASGALALFLLGDAVVRAGWGQMLLLAPWVLLALWIAYQLSASSFVRIDDSGAVVQNMLRRTTFGWRRVRDVDMRWQLEFALDDDRTVTAWGGPNRARPPKQTRRDVEDGGVRVPAGLRDLTEIRDRWDAAPGADVDAPIRRVWDVPALAALAVIAVWALTAVLLTR